MPEIYEYRGVSDLVCAEVTKDDSTGITFGAVEPICGVAEIGRSSSSTSEAHYYDNIPACTVVTDGVDTITLQLSAIPLPIKAKLTGHKYDAATGTYMEGTRKIKYFAIGYKTQATNGDVQYVWRLKGTFNDPDEDHKTIDASTDANGQTLVYTGIKTTSQFANGGEDGQPDHCASVCVNTALDLIANKAGFFDSVQTPDTIQAKGETPSVSVVPSRASVEAGQKVQLTAIKIPANASIAWTSSNTSYATVDQDTGEVTGVSAGTATITATITVGTDTYTDTCSVTVTAASA